jgi:hypothetical protein
MGPLMPQRYHSHHQLFIGALAAALALGEYAQPGPTTAGCDHSDFCNQPYPCVLNGPNSVSFNVAGGAGVRKILFFEASPCFSMPGAPADIVPFDARVQFERTTDFSTWSFTEGIAHAQVSGGPGEPVFEGLDWDVELLALDISGAGLPPGMMIRESPTLASLGHTSTYHPAGPLNHIACFFDVFTELSMDGGQSWTPADQSTHIEYEIGYPTKTAPASWGLIKLLYRN